MDITCGRVNRLILQFSKILLLTTNDLIIYNLTVIDFYQQQSETLHPCTLRNINECFCKVTVDENTSKRQDLLLNPQWWI